MFSLSFQRIFPARVLLACCLLCLNFNARAKEGMHVPATLKSKEADMRAMGLEIPVEELFNEQGTGLNNAVVLFGKGCTGEIISSKGLVLTNHHCGYGTVQGLSSIDHDYFARGFWAMNREGELPCPGLTVTFVRGMENITARVLNGIDDTLNDIARNAIISKRIQSLEKAYAYTSGLDASIRPLYTGNQYYVFLTQTYKDIRLVAFPPNGIGVFGGDAENWMWPRHTGDFSMFRVYAGAGNKPADYAKDNKPYDAKEFFTINAGGYKEGDFTMVYGFPAVTDEYVTSSQVQQVQYISDPIRIAVRTQKLGIWNASMQQSRDVFLKYTSKRAGIANGWKKWQGEVKGLQVNNVTSKKLQYEQRFQQWAVAHDSAYPYAVGMPALIEAQTISIDSILKTDEYVREAVYGIELISQATATERLMQCFRTRMSAAALQDTLTKLVKNMGGFYKNYDAPTDEKVFAGLMQTYFAACPGWLPSYYRIEYQQHGSDFAQWAHAVYNTSLFTTQERLQKFAANATVSDSLRLLSDPAWQLYHSISVMRSNHITPALTHYSERMRYLNRLYMKAQMAQRNGADLYPDANFTLRLSYGKVKGIDPDGAAPYSYQTTLNEVVALDDSTSYEFKVPQKLKDLYAKKDYGHWAVNKTVPVAFITDNHTSGGNSGSPVLNAKGQLIGTNFDRVWEGTMSDLNFDPRLCRNISLDVRYTLFIIDKFGGAGWLLKEMKIVR
ncbi:MAG: S46 family peptidase [Taibaiella sp.]|nr:S46 family peptidase [Taibaiella sp.]